MARSTSGMDKNGQIAALLRDFAAIQKSKQSMWGYKRAASAILALEQPIDTLLKPDGTLQKIANVGPRRRGSSSKCFGRARCWRSSSRRRTRPASWRLTRPPRSRTRASPASRPIASSTAGHWTVAGVGAITVRLKPDTTDTTEPRSAANAEPELGHFQVLAGRDSGSVRL
jgi:hypothetical protein